MAGTLPSNHRAHAVMRNQSKRENTSGTQMKTALYICHQNFIRQNFSQICKICVIVQNVTLNICQAGENKSVDI